MDTFSQRVRRAFKLDLLFYSTVARDSTLNRESYFLVISPPILSLALNLCLFSVLLSEMTTNDMLFLFGPSLAFVAVFFAQVGLIYWMGRHFLHNSVSYMEIHRALSYVFFVGSILAFVPCVGFLSGFWSLAANYVATQAALQIGKGPAFVVLLFSYLLSYGTLFLLIASLANVSAFLDWLLNRFYFLN